MNTKQPKSCFLNGGERNMIKIKLPNESKNTACEFGNEKELNKFLKESHKTFHMLQWIDFGSGRIYNGIC